MNSPRLSHRRSNSIGESIKVCSKIIFRLKNDFNLKVSEVTNDIIDFEQEYTKQTIQKDPLYKTSLFSWPNDDVAVDVLKRDITPNLPVRV